MNDIERAIKCIEFIQCENKDLSINTKLIAIKEILEKQLNDKWILVNEKLPERSIPVLVSDKQENVCIRAITCEIKGKKYWSQDKYDVLAWQPLPEPYKEVENAKNKN